MTQNKFESEIRRMLRRLQLLEDVNSGAAKLRVVHVPATRVRPHVRRAHVRHIAPAGWRARRPSR